MLKKAQRITSSRLISLLFKKGTLYRSKAFNIRFLPSLHHVNQFVIVVSKKVSAKAVERNVVKRRISEWTRINLDQFHPPIVALILAHPDAKTYTYSDLEKEFLNFLSHYQKLTHVYPPRSQ